MATFELSSQPLVKDMNKARKTLSRHMSTNQLPIFYSCRDCLMKKTSEENSQRCPLQQEPSMQKHGW